MNKENNKIYEDFFRENELVLSSYFSMHWCLNGFWNLKEQINIFSKIPFKAYVWINRIKSKKILINKVFSFNRIENNFKEESFYNLNKKSNELIEFLTDSFEDNINKWWYEINILLELERWHWYWITGMIWSLIISGIYYLNDKIKNNNFKLEEIIKQSSEFEKISKKWNSIWEASYTTFINHNKLILQSINKNIDIYKENNIDYDNDLPFDYYIIFSWIKSDTLQIENIRKIHNKDFDFERFLKNNLWEEFILWENKNIKKIINQLNLKTFFYFYKILTVTEYEKEIEKLFQNLNNIRKVSELLEWGIDFVDRFEFIFNKYKGLEKEKIWILPLHSSKIWGSYLIVLKKEISDNTIKKTLNNIKKYYPDSYVEHNSNNQENIKNYWINIEQDLYNNIFSDYINRDFKIIEFKNKKVISDKIDIKEIDAEIIVDSIKEKVYIKWKKLTSKEIQSQKQIVEILLKLLENNIIKNTDLNSSSYSMNKNEMSGKIIYPFIKVVEEKLNKDINLKISGSISNFSIKLDKNNIKFSIIKNI